jgi:hypothetical protein
MNGNSKKKLILEPMLRSGGWKITEAEFEPKKAILQRAGKERRFRNWDGVGQFASKFFNMSYRPLKSFDEYVASRDKS